jgi:hypothetical protein
MSVHGGRLLLFSFLLFAATRVAAQGKSLIFIQGDKELPFYVTVNGEMVSRFYKNHVVITKLKGGSYDLQILFEQNKHTPVHYSVSVSDSSTIRFYLCTHNGGYALYDLEKKTYLAPSGQ